MTRPHHKGARYATEPLLRMLGEPCREPENYFAVVLQGAKLSHLVRAQLSFRSNYWMKQSKPQSIAD